MDDRIRRREKRDNVFGVVAFCITQFACNPPSTDGLYGRGGSASSAGGVGGVGAMGGFGGSGSEMGGAGNPGAVGGAGGSGGSGGGIGVVDPPDASVADAEAPRDSGPDAASSCSGALLGGICWYLGGAGESCNQVCAPRGGFAPAAIEVVGTGAQGGSVEECSAVLDVLADEPGVGAQSGTQAAEGVGCHLYEDDDGELVRWWLTSPAFDPDASLAGAPLACGCNE